MHADAIRARFAEAMSALYRREVPQYGTLLELVAAINQAVPREDPALAAQVGPDGEARLAGERHGAIRLGTAGEMGLMRRLFAVLGMVPVGYYDLAPAGLPVHATAFRATDPQALRRSLFRVFASLLRPELIADAALRERAGQILRGRRIVTPRAMALIEHFERAGGLDADQAEEFIAEALHSFRWHGEATVDLATYRALSAAHPLIADIVCFKGPHINHLTPRVLDIDAAQSAMQTLGLRAKTQIEGPPRRACPILLRQTSFLALGEPVRFGDEAGAHTARFGEVEQRGVALTPRGRALYDRLLACGEPDAFADFPDDHAGLRAGGLAFYRYRACADLPLGLASLEEAIQAGSVRAEPITYEDFLPVSAAGIFRSNLSEASGAIGAGEARQGDLEAALGCAILDPFALYAAQSDASAACIAL